MIDTRRAQTHLGIVREVIGWAAASGVEVRLRGGWAMDFFLGYVTRDHEDLDFFGWSDDAPLIVREMTRRGFHLLAGPPPGQQADFVRDGEEVSFAWVARRGDAITVAGGPWQGEPWPDGMFDGPPGQIGNVVCPIINPLAQIEIKQMMPVWVPGLPVRAKDVADVEMIRAALDPIGH